MNMMIHGDMEEFSIEQIDSERREESFPWKSFHCASFDVSCLRDGEFPFVAEFRCWKVDKTGSLWNCVNKRHLVTQFYDDDGKEQQRDLKCALRAFRKPNKEELFLDVDLPQSIEVLHL